ncbi:hypothetical protein [Kitasatospora brasiliensis]|uniref:hypothetical protein n=1 Tax=Kitasatospora brasiliensis TaxID=3058040 RepID=UPI00292FF9CD|nr:hypothetical protein [Kitasatospora sp. K002]
MAHQRLTGNSSGDCREGECPNVYLTDRGTLVFQGDQYGELTVPAHENAVELPENIVKEAVRALGW